METINKSELETIEHLDFEHEIPCFWRTPCNRKVVCRAVHQCCGQINFHCDDHKNKAIEYLVWLEEHPTTGVVHDSCGFKFPLNTPADDILQFYPVEM